MRPPLRLHAPGASLVMLLVACGQPDPTTTTLGPPILSTTGSAPVTSDPTTSDPLGPATSDPVTSAPATSGTTTSDLLTSTTTTTGTTDSDAAT